TSFRDGRKVKVKIFERLPATLLLNVVSLFLIFALAFPIGIISALKHNSTVDKILAVLVFVAYSVPSFVVALLLILFFGVKLGVFPISGMMSVNFEYLSFWGRAWDIARHLALPAVSTAIGGLAFLSRYLRSSMLEVIRQDYIKAARSRGVPEKKLIFVHALKNAFIPMITVFGLLLPALIGGSVVFETIFSWPGMGRLAYESIMARDYPVVMGIGVIMAVLTLGGNFLADIGYAAADPRIRYE
ncbi:MAG: ABC transporter permease, partial [Elusimicrobiota bacterium]